MSTFTLPNATVDTALTALTNEANRVDNKSAREKTLQLVQALRMQFNSLQGQKTSNPEGKTVVRDKSGKVLGLQG
jgi:hypothetical protein